MTGPSGPRCGGALRRPQRAPGRACAAPAALAALALTLALALAGAAPPADAVTAAGAGTGPFGLTPSLTAAGRPRPYFALAIAPGGLARDDAIISNEGTTTERLRVSTVAGVTALNSGSAFGGAGRGCLGPACWVTGLPAVVTLAPGSRRVLPFRVAVPAGTAPGQYLAGLAAEPALRPRPVRIGRAGRATARVVIVDEVVVGVAVTVGSRSQLRTVLSIGAVTGGSVGTTPRLYIHVHNAGQTFTKATGAVTCLAGGRHRSYRVIMDTVLPGQGAVIPINAAGLGTGPVPCRLVLHDGAARPVIWSGTVDLPVPTPAVTLLTGRGVYTAVPRNTVPPWAVALMVIGVLILAALGALLLRRRR
ncbi:MAG TPA: hypothetical protein VIX86_17805 [Streptosporangiaceae bacterium]